VTARTGVVVVTGAAGGLGSATCRHLAERGWTVLAADLPGEGLDRLATHPAIAPVPLDVTDPDGVAGLADEVARHTDRLSGVVNFAGVLAVGPLIEIPERLVHRLFDVNVFGMFRVNQALFPLLERGHGRVVNISSETGWQSGGPFNGPYGMSKHAVEAYSDSLRRELMFLGIRVIKIQPGPFRTAMVESVDDRFREAQRSSARFGRLLARTGEMAAREQRRAHDPTTLARVVERALTARRPRPAYSVRPAPSRVALEWLPTSVADLLIRLVLSR
jgi:NAD(P)-dependent dehydrogenase (short-subunit alcohol dehydrogenase family)